MLIWIIASLSGTAFAESAKVDLQGQFRIRTEQAERTDLATRKGYSLLRARADAKVTLSETVRLFVQPQFTRTLGELAYPGSSGTANAETLASGGTYDSAVGVHQAWAELGGDHGFSFRAGRMVLSYGDELLIGGLEWNNVGRAFDGARLRWSGEDLSTDLFFTKLVEGQSGADASFFGLYHSFRQLGPLDELDLYGLGLLDGRSTSGDLKVWTAGLRLKSAFESFDARWESSFQGSTASGTKRDAYQAEAELGWKPADGIPRVALGALSASTHFNSLFPTAHKWLGMADILGRRNVTSVFAKVGGKAGPDLSYSLEVNSFRRFSDEGPAYKLNGSSGLGSASASRAHPIGTELDVWSSYAFSPETSLSGGVAVLLPGEYLKSQFGTEAPSFFYLQLEVRAK